MGGEGEEVGSRSGCGGGGGEGHILTREEPFGPYDAV